VCDPIACFSPLTVTTVNPFQTLKVSITGCGNFHKSNPTTAFLKDGRVMMSYRFNYEGEMVAFAVADSFKGPFKSIANLTHGTGNDEDSYLWQQPDGSLHGARVLCGVISVVAEFMVLGVCATSSV
jgi:hypothetical protein